jgi:hypothetical protein
MPENSNNTPCFINRVALYVLLLSAFTAGACDGEVPPVDDDSSGRVSSEKISGILLLKMQMSPTASMAFYEIEPGLVAVNVRAHVDLDTNLHPQMLRGNTLPEMFHSLQRGQPAQETPAVLLEAQKRVDAYNARLGLTPSRSFSSEEQEHHGIDSPKRLDRRQPEVLANHVQWDWVEDFRWFREDVGPGVEGDSGACNNGGFCRATQCTEIIDSTAVAEVGGSFDSRSYRSTGMCASFHTTARFRTYRRDCGFLGISCDWKLFSDQLLQPRTWSQLLVGGIGHLSQIQNDAGEEMRGYVGMETGFTSCN